MKKPTHSPNRPKELRAIEKACKAYAAKYREQCIIICAVNSPHDDGMLFVNGSESKVRGSLMMASDQIDQRYAAAREQYEAAQTA